MPELPEVEGLRRRLAPLVVGRRVERLEVRDPKLWLPAPGLTAADVEGLAVRSLDRYAKVLVFVLEGELALLLHLKIAGQVVYDAPGMARGVGGHPYPLPGATLPDASTRFVLYLQGGVTLWINDQRRFAWLRLTSAAGVDEFLAAQRYGPDPLDATFSSEVLAERLRARKGRPIKAALLDQTCIAGIGNIYADEALHRARLHPLTRAGDLSAPDVSRLHQAIRDVLEVAVPVGGAIVKIGRAIAEPETGRDFLRAHGRAGALCPNCVPALLDTNGRVRAPSERDLDGPRIVRAVVAGRGTYYCPQCQPAPG